MSTVSDNGRYVLGRAIGAGGQGQVFEARQLDLDRRVAIKRLSDPGQIRHEARILASLRHPNLVMVYELIEVEGHPALVMEYVEGPDLATLVRNADLDPDRALALWLAVVDGLAHAHRNGVVHGDVCPSNILVEVEAGVATPRICDFGVGRSRADPLGSEGGTVGFIAPERRDGAPPTMRSDVYSMAAVGRFLLPQGMGDSIDEVVSRSMSSEPSARPPDAGALLRELDLDRESISQVGLPVLDLSPGPRGRRWGWLALAAVLVSLSVPLALWLNRAPSFDASLALEAMQRWRSEPAQAAALWHAAGGSVPPHARAVGADARVLPHERTVVQLAAHEDHLVAADEDGVVRGWDPSTGVLLWRIDTSVLHPRRLGVSGDHVTLSPHSVYGENPSGCVVWSIDSGDCTVSLPVDAIEVLLRGGGDLLWHIVRSSEAGLLEEVVLDVTTQEYLWRRQRRGSVRVALHPDHPDEIVVLGDGLMERVAVRTGERTLLQEDISGDWLVVWTDDGVRLVTADATIGVSDPLPEHRPTTSQMVFSTSVGIVLGGGRSQFGVLHGAHGSWNIRHRGWFGPVAWGGDSLLATSPLDGPVELVDARSGRVHRTLMGHERNLLAMTVVGDWLATSSADRSVRLWRPVDRDDGWQRREDTGLRPVRLVSGERLALLGRTDTNVWTVWTEALGTISLGVANTAAIDDNATIAVALTAAGDMVLADLSDGVIRHQSLDSIGARCLDLDPLHDRMVVTTPYLYELRRLSDGAMLASEHFGGRPAGCAALDPAGEVWFVSGVPPRLQALALGIDVSIAVESAMSGFQFTRDGFVAIALNGHLFSGDADGAERVDFDARRVIGGTTRFAWTDNDGRVHVGGEQPWQSPPRGRVDSLAWAAGEAVLLAARADGVIDSWSRSGRLLSSVQAHDQRLFALAVHEESGQVVSVDLDGVLQWWDLSRLTAESAPLVTNYRLCRGTDRVVPMVPFPDPEVRWAPREACLEP